MYWWVSCYKCPHRFPPPPSLILICYRSKKKASRSYQTVPQTIQQTSKNILFSLLVYWPEWKTSRFAPSGLKRSEEHTSELQSRENLVCRLLLEKKNKYNIISKAITVT